MITYILYILLAVCLLFGLSFLLPGKKGVYGSAVFVSLRKNKVRRWNKGLVIDGIRRLPIKKLEHIAIIGSTGSGKTMAYLLPSVLKLRGSMIIVDLKSEIQPLCSSLHQTHDVLVLDFGNIYGSLQFNPLLRLKSETSIRNFFLNIYDRANMQKSESAVWRQSAVGLFSSLTSCLLEAPAEYRNLANLIDLLYSINDDGSVDRFVEKYCPNDRVKKVWKQFITSDAKLRSNILMSALSAISIWNTDEIKYITATDSIPFEQLREKPTAIFLKIPAGQVGDSFFDVISIFYSQLFSWVLESEVKKDAQPIYLLADEFANTYVKNFSKIISLVRSKKMSCSIILQDLQKLSALYGEHEVEAILSNISHFIVYRNQTGFKTLEYIQGLLGVSSHKYINPNTGLQETSRRPLLTNDEIRVMDHGLYIGEGYSSKIYPKPLYKQKRFMRKCGIRSSDGRLYSNSVQQKKSKPKAIKYLDLDREEVNVEELDFKKKLNELLPPLNQ